MAYITLTKMRTEDEHGNREVAGTYEIRGPEMRGEIEVLLEAHEDVPDFDAPRALMAKLHGALTELQAAVGKDLSS